MVAAAAVMGKPGFAYLKGQISRFLRAHGPPATVSRARYRVGLVMFALPVFFGWVTPYAAQLVPGLGPDRLLYALTGDGLLLASLFVLGGDFWDKLRALFVHGARAKFAPPDAASR